jgi:F420-dependent oxidoreductase-like protein
VRLGYHTGYWSAGPPPGVEDAIATCERLGFDSIWTAEAYGSDCLTPLAWWGAKTSSVRLGTNIMQMSARAPAAAAMAAMTLDHLSGGRFVLGLGASGPQVIEGWHGVPYHAPIGRTREIIEICRTVWRRERLSYEGRYYKLPLPAEEGTGLGKPLKLINHPVRERIPIIIASLGPKNVEMTAELAEGWEPIFYLPEKAGHVWGEALARGRAKRDPALGELDVVAQATLAIGDDVEGFLDFGRPMAALYIGGMGAKGKNFYNDLARRYGYEREAEEIQDLYLDGKKQEAAEKVPYELLQKTSLIGTEGFVRDRLAALKESGVTTLNVTPVAGDHEGRVRLIEKVRELAASV